ncbi:TPA: hypothetical protein N2150_003652 [Escherichia coli]|nr:hypothetical protein [Escherichia coli]
MSAKSKLLERINTLEATLALPVLINQPLGNVAHNKAATFLRKGLGIVTFNILEDYIKERTLEMFDAVSSSMINFSYLPDDLQEAATLGALRALVGKVRNEKKNNGNWLGLIQSETANINSTSLVNNFTISQFSLMSESSNINADEVSKVLKCLNINGGWGTLQRISQEIYGGVPNLSQSYGNISMRRHSAAHEAGFDYEYGWLQTAVREIMAIASSFDVALSTKCKMINLSPAVQVAKDDLSNMIKYRFLQQANNGQLYKEKVCVTSASIKNWTDLNLAKQMLAVKCRTKSESLVILNSQTRIIDWLA